MGNLGTPNGRYCALNKTLPNFNCRLFVLVIFASCFLVTCGDFFLPGSQNVQVAPGSVEFFQRDPKALVRGNAIYLGSCANFCHEYSLPEGARLNLFDCSWVYGGTNAEIAGVIRKGLKGKRMPGFGDNFPEEHDLNKVVAYLRSKEGSCDAIL